MEMLSFAHDEDESEQRVQVSQSEYIPRGVSDLLELVSREVLRKQPKNVIEFVANFLSRLVDLRDGKRESKSDLTAMHLPIPSSLLVKKSACAE